ncbi:hypothetical protein ES288_A12G108800v1 [Gossypium darwinii]|uniref:GED domain-containing protein n=1 Tax=Gossypium darwinii TaxID=34276 RepID=A0A5D2E7W8_GOSDA|nr:hypothetical protein ES288_A12G108800v1 [Gossypium darwinii]
MILEGKSYRLKFPWVGVVNRSQANINKNVDMIAARRREREYFSTTPEYRHLAHRMGSEHLAKMLSKHLETVIKSRIPGIQSLINKTIAELETELSRLGKPIAADAGGKLCTIMEICCLFYQNFREHLDGVYVSRLVLPSLIHLSLTSFNFANFVRDFVLTFNIVHRRTGGDKVYNVFDNQLPAALKRILGSSLLKLMEADGYQPHLIAPEQGYCHLIESTLVTIRGPAEAAVDATHSILKDLVHKAMSETPELKQYPALRVEVGNAAIESLERMRDQSKKATLQLVDMECCYLTVEFFRKLPQDVDKGGSATQSIFDRYNDSYLRRIGSTVLSYVNMVCATLRHSIPKSIVYCQVREAKRSLLDFFYTELGKLEQKRLSALLNEDPTIMERRSALAKRLEL